MSVIFQAAHTNPYATSDDVTGSGGDAPPPYTQKYDLNTYPPPGGPPPQYGDYPGPQPWNGAAPYPIPTGDGAAPIPYPIPPGAVPIPYPIPTGDGDAPVPYPIPPGAVPIPYPIPIPIPIPTENTGETTGETGETSQQQSNAETPIYAEINTPTNQQSQGDESTSQ